MRINFKNIVMTSTFLFLPAKSVNMAQTVKYHPAKQICCPSIVDVIKQRRKKIYDFLCSPLVKMQEMEAKKPLNIIKMTKPSKDLDISKTKFVGSPQFLNMFLSGVMKGKGEQFIKAQEKHGINATFLIGIANLESGYGLSSYAVKRNNIAGMRNKQGYMYFKSVDDCIDKMAENLKRKYVDDGLTTIKQIGKRYAENPNWANVVVEKMNPMYSASKAMVYNFEK